MYNRYIPQSDGSFTRNRVPDRPPASAPRSKKAEPAASRPPLPDPPVIQKQNTPSPGFLKQLLPKGFDTGDLIIILLLFLMAGESEAERNNAILTIALYFLM